MVFICQMEPGHVITRYVDSRLEVIVQGTLVSGDRVLQPGRITVWTVNPFYGPKIRGR
jgi:hypothetical protein